MSNAAQVPATTSWRTPIVVILAGCLIAMIGFGIRSSFGLFLEPMTVAKNWSREEFALAMAIQNLLWGAGVPVAGALADKFGPTRVLVLGAIVYAAGVWGMGGAETPMQLNLFGGLLTGLGVAFTAFSIALAAMARVVGPQKRSMALGLGTAAGSLGQVVFSPLAQTFIDLHGWHDALLIMAGMSLMILLLAFLLPSGRASGTMAAADQTIGEALREAFAHHGFVLLTVGFFVCGFHVAFITVHFPAYVKDLGLSAHVGAVALALIGLFNIVGSLGSGVIGQRFSKKNGLAVIYFLRSLAILGLLLAPKTALTIYIFAGVMGILWLSTVPLTTGIVAQVFGVRYMTMLFGIVFFSHQIGSFLGVWLGGYFFDTTGSYDPIWWSGVVLGLVAALIHIAINEKPLPRLAEAAV